jgi:nucleolar protein 56
MAARLVSTWYGSFLLDDRGELLTSALFPRAADEIAERLREIREGHVLDEERLVAKEADEFQVLEDRLLSLPGAVRGEPSQEGPTAPDPGGLGFPPGLLREASLALATTAIREALPADQPVVLYLRSMDLVEKEGTRAFEMLRYWHSFHFPELGALVDDSTFLELVSSSPDRKDILKARPDLDPGVDSGRPLADDEGEAMRMLAEHVIASRAEGRKLRDTLEEAMHRTAPNLVAVAGPLVGARLLSLAGSLERLARMPSSTIQLLGAERALFLHIKEGTPAPKHGVIFQHPSVHSAPPWLRGRIARTLAGKIAIAARADMYGPSTEGELGSELRDQFLERAQRLRIDHPDPPPGWRRSRGVRRTRDVRGKRSRGRRRSKGPKGRRR